MKKLNEKLKWDQTRVSFVLYIQGNTGLFRSRGYIDDDEKKKVNTIRICKLFMFTISTKIPLDEIYRNSWRYWPFFLLFWSILILTDRNRSRANLRCKCAIFSLCSVMFVCISLSSMIGLILFWNANRFVVTFLD